MAAFYGVYQGPEGLQRVAKQINDRAYKLAIELTSMNFRLLNQLIFDTVSVKIDTDHFDPRTVMEDLFEQGFDVRLNNDIISFTVDENVTDADISEILTLMRSWAPESTCSDRFNRFVIKVTDTDLARTSPFMEDEVFHKYRTETNLKRFIRFLEKKDITLTQSMIPLGSCTMKLNSATELAPVSWPQFANIHPLQTAPGYEMLVRDLEHDLGQITDLHSVSLQPNSGAQGEFTGLMMIRKYLGPERDICLIPSSAHGTNPASCIQAGLKPMPVKLNDDGSIDLDDLNQKCREYGNKIACLMITYPSTYGIFDDNVREVCDLVHKAGGQIYMDGANMNAQIGLTSPGTIGADICHLNLHKTFCVPHGGGGPGVGPVCARSHLEEFLPIHQSYPQMISRTNSVGPVTSAPYGNAGVLPITWSYIKMMGSEGLKLASETAILNANYLMKKIEDAGYMIRFKNKEGMVGHEFIVDVSPFKKLGITEVDIAKRLIDHGYHSPTMSWPVPSSLMIEPTESEDRDELDRFAESMESIREEIREIEIGKIKVEDSPLRHAPHTHQMATCDDWNYKYPRSQAIYPVNRLRENKYWPPISRVNDVLGDKMFLKKVGE
jgi:glycine dehydrogenase